MIRLIISFIIIITVITSFWSCKKDKLLTDPSATLSFSQDSVLFDTVFTSIGSTTRQIKVRNLNNQKINISSISFEKGTNSQFIMNVDGTSGKEINNVEILANDSVYVFIQVNVNPNLPVALSPFIIQDKMLFSINGNQQFVALEAWGQNAHYHFPDKAIQFKNGFLPYSTVSTQTNVTVNWGGGSGISDNRPHVVYGWLVVDSTQTLIINQGMKIYFHQGAGLWVYRYGTLQVNGVANNEVVFQGDRREEDYLDLPGQWDRIWINEGSKNNYINYAIIKNNGIGIQASLFPFFSPPNTISYDETAPKRLKITNTIIKNCSNVGLYAFAYDTWMANSLVCNTKGYSVAVTNGGNAVFLHNTFANYFNKEGGRGEQPCFHLDNFDGTNIWNYDSLYFGNCIVDGSIGNELEIDIRTPTAPTKIYQFNSCLLKGSAITATASVNNFYNLATHFEDPSTYNFKLKSNSEAKAKGNTSFTGMYPFLLATDLTGLTTRSGTPSVGCYE